MGMFKNMRDLQKQAKDIEASMPPVGQRMADAQARMANAQQMMAAQTQAAQAAAGAAAAAANGTGTRHAATITGMRQVGMINFDLLVQFDLTLLADGLPPRPATAQQAVSQMQIGQIRPGMSIDAIADPNNPNALWLDLSTVR